MLLRTLPPLPPARVEVASSPAKGAREDGGFRRLVLATDFSPTSERALLFASRLLSRGGRIRLLHVVNGGSPGKVPELLIPVRAQTATRLERDAAQVRGRGLACSRRLAYGEPHVEIPREAERFGAEAIACGTRGLRGLPRLFLGSVAERLFRTARLPLVIVPPVPFGRSIRHVLFATDFSPASRAALDLLERLSRERSWNVTVQHVLEPTLSAASGAVAGSWREMNRRGVAAVAELRAVADRLRGTGVSAAERLDAGDPFIRVLRRAREEDVDLLVLGTRGPAGPAKLFLGSVSSKLVRASRCPLLVVPAPPEKGNGR